MSRFDTKSGVDGKLHTNLFGVSCSALRSVSKASSPPAADPELFTTPSLIAWSAPTALAALQGLARALPSPNLNAPFSLPAEYVGQDVLFFRCRVYSVGCAAC